MLSATCVPIWYILRSPISHSSPQIWQRFKSEIEIVSELSCHFISGLPRSGSTLLANLLAQNPRFHSTATSGILEILFLVRNGWDKVLEFRAAVDRAANEAEKVRVLRGILQAYHGERGRPVVFDK
jgi:sulfotransferase